MTHNDVVIVMDIHGEEERCRVLWMCRGKVRVKSLTHKHKKAFAVKPEKIVRNEGQLPKQGVL